MTKPKKGNLEEMSAMAGGAVQGAAAPEDEEVEEELQLKKMIKEVIKSAINKKIFLEKERIEEQKKFKSLLKPFITKAIVRKIDEEKQLRTLIKVLLQEAGKDVESTPHSSTAINILEEMLKQILPNLETQYKTLTTAKEQRDSFRAHVVNAVSVLLETEDVNKEGGAGAEEEGIISLDEDDDDIEEEIDIKVSDVDASAEDKFIDIEGGEPVPEEEEDTFGLEGQDATGRALAQDAFTNMEKNITETYAILHDEEDEKLFKDYLVTNLKLYFDKWEKELGAVTEPTTDEYETEKDQGEAGAEAGAEFDAELGGEFGGEIPPAPAAAVGEELIQ